MPVTLRTYTVAANWNAASLFSTLRQAFQDLGVLPSSVDLSVSRTTLITSTTLAGQANRDYLVLADYHTFGSGTRWYITRSATGAVSTAQLAFRGTGLAGGANPRYRIVGTYSQNASTTITITRPCHGLTQGQSVYVDFASGATDGAFTVTSVLNPHQFTITAGTSGTNSGNATIYTCHGTYTRSGTAITAVVNNHGLTTGDWVYFTALTGSGTSNRYQVTVTDANTFTVTDTTSGTVATSRVALFPMVRINGSKVGGVDSTDDIWIAIGGANYSTEASTSTWTVDGTHPANGGSWVLWNAVTDATKRYGSTPFLINYESSSFQLAFRSALQICLDTDSTNIFLGSGSGVHTVSTNLSTTNAGTGEALTVGNSTTNPITIRTYQSGFNNRFCVIEFSQVGVSYGACILPLWTPDAGSPLTLDDVCVGSPVRILSGTSSLTLSSNRTSVVPLLSYEAEATNAPNTGSWAFLSQSYFAGGNIGGGNNFLFSGTLYPTTSNFGPLVNKIPMLPGLTPSPATMPDDFGLIVTNTIPAKAGDTLTVSPTEVYTVVRSNASTTLNIAFVARTT